jgi:hypothetical protein
MGMRTIFNSFCSEAVILASILTMARWVPSLCKLSKNLLQLLLKRPGSAPKRIVEMQKEISISADVTLATIRRSNESSIYFDVAKGSTRLGNVFHMPHITPFSPLDNHPLNPYSLEQTGWETFSKYNHTSRYFLLAYRCYDRSDRIWPHPRHSLVGLRTPVADYCTTWVQSSPQSTILRRGVC